jgi:beta-glucanase (GH16 family)
VFSIEWKQDEINWYADNVLYGSVSKADLGANNYPFNEQFYFIINLAIGGNFPGSPDANTIFPRWFMIDYIRVFQ